jgi:hypothetical protein
VTTAEWELALETGSAQRVVLAAGADIGYTVQAVWELAKNQWGKGDRPAWQLALPTYGQSPV